MSIDFMLTRQPRELQLVFRRFADDVLSGTQALNLELQ